MGCSRLAAALLVNRGIESAQQAHRFLNPAIDQLRPSTDLADMHKSSERVAEAILKQENILVFGDYDADGIAATVLLMRFFNDCRTRAGHYSNIIEALKRSGSKASGKSGAAQLLGLKISTLN